MYSRTQTARETIVAYLRRHHLAGAGAQYFDVLIAGYDAELEAFERSVAGMKAELARLATQKAENLPDGERRFRYRDPAWEWMITLNPPSLARNKGDGFGWHDIDARGPDAPPLGVLAEQFAKLGREVGFAQKIDSLESATRERIAAIEEERDRARDDARDTFRDLNAARERIATLERDCDTWRDGCAVDQRDIAAARERIAELEAQLAAKDADYRSACLGLSRSWSRGYKAAGARIAELDQREEDSRAEVADLLGRVEAQWNRAEEQKARAEGAEREIERLRRVAAEKQDFYRRSAEQWGRGIEQSREALAQFRDRAETAEGRLAVLEGELVAAKNAAASHARTEGDPRRIIQIAADNLGPLALAADGTAWFAVRFMGDFEPWKPMNPLPPIEPARAGGIR